MNFKKLMQIVNYILAKYNYELNYTKLIKLLYIADRECLLKYDFAISGDSYCSMPQGPVLSNLYDFIRNINYPKPEQIEFNSAFYKNGYHLISRLENKCVYDELCDAEISILDDVDAKYHDKDWTYLVDNIVHKFPEWDKNASNFNTSYPLPKQVILRNLNKTEKEIKAIIETEESLSQVEENLKAKGLV
ncbi:Panacea domain-containing protein [Endomicrobium proavitum]|uniref:Antitoxin SocA-like Panacea domain-containing protein n=1 Tax=Endomicrobium proavitum TaxID=1408281 RepID=A0A0G3WJK6_9BACT|nr:Panacea domain-containing protein [Endomicrobium proavitum]AKL98042.1 hypothetical protein Epro_0663 [Endomicrobium proavitum]